MIVNICVWDALFSTGCRNPDLLWPLNSLAHSLASLHCLFFFTFCHLSFVISQHVLGCSLHRLSVSHCSDEFTAGTRTRTHKHMSEKQKPDLASREFFILCYLERAQKVRSRAVHAMWVLAVRIEKDCNKLLAWGGSVLTSARCTLNLNHKTKVVTDNCNETTSSRNVERKKWFYETQLESKIQQQSVSSPRKLSLPSTF